VQLSNSTRESLGDQKKIYSTDTSGARVANRVTNQPGFQPGFGSAEQCVDYVAETDVSEQCVKAWRVALAGDVPGGMKILEGLDKKYPNMKTVTFMKGQIQQHAGNMELARKYYSAAVVGDEFDSMKMFKLAESERETDHESDAIAHYQKLLASVPNFVPAELGLAKAYLKGNAKSVDAKKCLQHVLAADPDGKEKTTIEAKRLLQEFNSRSN
jgi:tetratricopeptide (TPR) repeat protein